MLKLSSKEGFSLVELLVVISFLSVMIVLIAAVSSFNKTSRVIYEERSQAILYAMEAAEAIKLMDWDDISSGDFHLEMPVSTWQLASGSELIDNQYTRNINISDVYRENLSNGHSYGDIVDIGGYLDPDSKKITISIDWPSRLGDDKQEILENYIYRWDTERFTQTDWSGGDGQVTWLDESKFFSKTTGVDISVEGISTLSSGFLDWNQGTTTATTNISAQDTTGISFLDGYVYIITENNSSGDEFFVYDVSDIYDPSYRDSLNIGGLEGVVVKGDYAYVAGTNDYNELSVIDISDPYDIFVEGNYNLSGDSNPVDIAVDETEVYIARSDRLYSLSISDPSNPQFLDDISVDNVAKAIYLSGDYIYLAADDNNRELQIFNVTNPASLGEATSYDLPGDLAGTDIIVQGNTAYLSTENNTSGREFFIFDISDPNNPDFLGDYEVGSTVHSFTIIGPYAILGTNNNSEEIVVIDVSFPSTINKVSGFNLDGYMYGLAANCSNVYGASSNSSEELLIFSTEEIDCGYADSGILESSTIDTGVENLVYNWIAWGGTEPENTEIRFQIATSANQSGPWNYFGPDGTGSTYYTTAASEFINYTAHQNQRYFRYKLYLNSLAELQAPILEEVTISYSTY